MIGWFNMGSLLLGLIALILAYVNVIRSKNNSQNNWVSLSIISMSAGAISLFFQLFNTYIRVRIEDWSALIDTMGPRVSVTFVFLVAIIFLNVHTLITYRNRQSG